MMDDEARQTMADLTAVPHPLELAILRCAGVLFGIEVQWVREIRPFTRPTPIYGLPPFWVGVTALRGELYAVLDLAQLLCPWQNSAEPRRQIVFAVANNLPVGLLVDEVLAVRSVSLPEATAVSAPDASYRLGTTPDQITILDLPALLTHPRLMSLAGRANGSET